MSSLGRDSQTPAAPQSCVTLPSAHGPQHEAVPGCVCAPGSQGEVGDGKGLWGSAVKGYGGGHTG